MLFVLSELGAIFLGTVAVMASFRLARIAGALDCEGLTAAIVWLALAVAAAVALFSKRRQFIKLCKLQAALYLLVVCAVLGSQWVAPTDTHKDRAIVGGLLAGVALAGIGWRYLNVSARVRNTFEDAYRRRPLNSLEWFLMWFALGFAAETFFACREVVEGTSSTALADALVQCMLIGMLFSGLAGGIVGLFWRRP